MSADFKSHILSRDEKGFFGIPLKRLLLAGVCGGLSYTVVGFVMRGAAIPTGVIIALAVLILTGLRGGMPLWQRLLYRLRGRVLLAAVRSPDGPFAGIARLLDLPTGVVRLNGAELFAPAGETALELREWVTFAAAGDADRDDGLIFVDSPELAHDR